MGLGLGIGHWDYGLGIGDLDWALGLGIGVGNWDWKLGLRIGIRDLRLGLGIEIGNCRLGLEIGRMTNDNDYTLHFVLMRMKFILFLHFMLELLLCFFEGCVVAGLMKN